MIDAKQFKKLMKKLTSLRNKEAKKAIRKGSRAGCKELLPFIKAATPVKTGAGRQNLKVRALPRSRTWTGCMVRLGPIGEAFYLSFVNYGTKNRVTKSGKFLGRITPQRFLNQATDEHKQQALGKAIDIIQAEMKRGLAA